MSELPELQCPQCGTFNPQTTAVCQCGHAFYPRAPMYLPPRPFKPPTLEERRASCATGGMVLGICSLFAGFAGFYGPLCVLIGMILSIAGLKSEGHRRRAIIGLVCSGIGLVILAIIGGVLLREMRS